MKRRWRVGLTRLFHATDTDLVALALEPAARSRDDLPRRLVATDIHLRRCSRCAAEFEDIRQTLDTIRRDADAGAADIISDDRLARQRVRIRRRLNALLGPPARVLQFPGFATPAFPAASIAARWVGVAAVAGLLIGVAVGHLADRQTREVHPVAETGLPARSASIRLVPTNPGSARRLPGGLGDEQLMAELEDAVAAPRVPTLVALDELTPRLRDIAVDVR